MTEARRPAHGYWFALFGAHSDPRGRLLCMATALAFLAFPVADLLSGRLSSGSEVVAAAGLVLFAGSYLRLFWILPSVARERRAEGTLGVIAALAIGLSIAFGDEWLGLLVYLSIALALALPTRAALAAIAPWQWPAWRLQASRTSQSR